MANYNVQPEDGLPELTDIRINSNVNLRRNTVGDAVIEGEFNGNFYEMENMINALRRDGNSIGARVTVVARNVPTGLGEPVFDKLDAEIAHAMMSINAVKGIEIGAGFNVVEQTGTEHRDEMTPNGFMSNNAGGIVGGISTGQDIHVNIALKPTSSITTPGRSVDIDGKPVEVVTKGRHDPCVGVRATPIAEAMLMLVLADHVLRHRGQNSEVTSVGPDLS